MFDPFTSHPTNSHNHHKKTISQIQHSPHLQPNNQFPHPLMHAHPLSYISFKFPDISLRPHFDTHALAGDSKL